MYELNWDKYFYPLYGSTITIPKDTVLWRGYDISYSPISNRPTFFGSKMTATGYAEQENKTLGTFQTTRPIKVIDVRYLKVLLRQLLEENKNTEFTKNDINMIKAITISYGICSLKHQIDLVKDVYGDSIHTIEGFTELEEYYKSTLQKNKSYTPPIIEEDGVRIAETQIDSYTLGFIKTLFEDIFDGIISPRLYSPFHIEKNNTMSPELVLFAPQECVSQIPPLSTNLLSVPINGIILSSNYLYTTKKQPISLTFYMKGGSHIGELLDKEDKSTIEQFNKGVKIGKKWRQRNMHIIAIEPVTPRHTFKLFE